MQIPLDDQFTYFLKTSYLITIFLLLSAYLKKKKKVSLDINAVAIYKILEKLRLLQSKQLLTATSSNI